MINKPMPISSNKYDFLSENRRISLSHLLFLVFTFLVPLRVLFFINLYGKKIQLSDIIFIILLTVFIYDVFKKIIKIRFTKVYIPFIFYLVAHLFSLINAHDKMRSLVELGGVIYLFLVFFICFNLINSIRIFKKFMVAWLIALILVVIFGFIGLFDSYVLKKADSLFMLVNCAGGRYALMHNFMPRVNSILDNPNMMMSYFILSIGILVYFFNKNKRGLRFLAITLIISIIFLSCFTISRDILGLLITIYLSLKLVRYANNKFITVIRYILSTLIIFLFSAFTILSIWEPSRIEISDKMSNGENNISIDLHRTNKSYFWQYALQMAKERPFIGIGSGNFNLKLNEYYLRDPKAEPLFAEFSKNDPHSTYLGILVELGIFGFMSFFGIIAILIYSLLKNTKILKHQYLKDVAYAIIACIIGILFQALAMDVQNLRHLWLIFGVAFALYKLDNLNEVKI